jgi:hypothetical protein
MRSAFNPYFDFLESTGILYYTDRLNRQIACDDYGSASGITVARYLDISPNTSDL